MREIGGVLFIVLAFLFWPGLVSADIVGMSQITVQGIVPPMRSVIVNDQNQITEIISNTTTYVAPTVYRNQILSSNEISITPLINQEYTGLGIQYNLNRVGIIYKHSPTTLITKKSLPLFLSILTWHNYDYLVSSIFNHALQPHFNL